MGKDSLRKPSHEGDELERGFVAVPILQDWPGQSPSDNISADKAYKAQDLDRVTKTAPGSNRSKEQKGSV